MTKAPPARPGGGGEAAFETVLVANRGEIACRVIAAARRLGYRTVAVYSAADEDARHVRMADQALAIGPAEAARSYLSIAAILEAAAAAGAGAIHPGYGFLSENAEFAAACGEAGLVFIGPSPEAIRLMADKTTARRRAAAAGVACVPGHDEDQPDDRALAAAAKKIGFPLFVKAVAGGGGRGLRLVTGPEGLEAALAAARREAEAAFGSSRLLLEKSIADARHVEVQIAGDRHGAVIHLGERDCSIQRRHQKIIEEAPCPVLSDQQRAAVGAAAVRVAKAASYDGVGTVEFLLDGEGEFYFLEMNTRLQVEHAVTELVTGVDLVDLQFEIAAGRPLPLTQDQVTVSGHAIEARVYAEDPARGFLPRTGRVLAWRPAAGPGIRVDHGLDAGTVIGPHYDPLLAKVIAHGATREQARRRLTRALEATVLIGPTTNLGFLVAVLGHDTFRARRATTGFVPEHLDSLTADAGPSPKWAALAAALLVERGHDGPLRNWYSTGNPVHPVRLAAGEAGFSALVAVGDGGYRVTVGPTTFAITIHSEPPDRLRADIDGTRHTVASAVEGPFVHLQIGAEAVSFEDVTYAPAPTAVSTDGLLRAPMSGKVIEVKARPGESVARGQVLVVLESMKMEHEVTAAFEGLVETVSVEAGDQVTVRQELVRLAPPPQ